MAKAKANPEPASPPPREGGSFTLNHETGMWEPTPAEQSESVESTAATETTDGSDS